MSLNEIIPPAFTLTLCESIGFETKSSFEEGIIPKNEFNKDSEHSLYTRDNWYAISSNRITIALIPMGNKEHAYIYSYSLKNNSVHLANKNIQIKICQGPAKKFYWINGELLAAGISQFTSWCINIAML